MQEAPNNPNAILNNRRHQGLRDLRCRIGCSIMVETGGFAWLHPLHSWFDHESPLLLKNWRRPVRGSGSGGRKKRERMEGGAMKEKERVWATMVLLRDTEWSEGWFQKIRRDFYVIGRFARALFDTHLECVERSRASKRHYLLRTLMRHKLDFQLFLLARPKYFF